MSDASVDSAPMRIGRGGNGLGSVVGKRSDGSVSRGGGSATRSL